MLESLLDGEGYGLEGWQGGLLDMMLEALRKMCSSGPVIWNGLRRGSSHL